MKNTQLGTVAIVALVALRLMVGWHFYKEGAKKFDPKNPFTAAHFLGGAKGPMKGFYRSFVPDIDGTQRFDKAGTITDWDIDRERAIAHFGFDEAQTEEANLIGASFEQQLSAYFADNDEDLYKFFKERDRLAEMKDDESMRGVAHQKVRIAAKETEVRGQFRAFMGAIGKIWDRYEVALNHVATKEQRDQEGWFELDRPKGSFIPLGLIDSFIAHFVIAIGILLIFGLFTRVAAIAGAGFLFSIITTQPPFATGAEDTYYQAIEMCAMFVLAVFAAGRYAGLDYLLHACCLRCGCMKKQGTSDESNA